MKPERVRDLLTRESATSDSRNETILPVTTQQLSPDVLQKTKLVLKRYGSHEQFMQTFNPDTQLIVAKNEERAIFGTAPTLGLMAKTYGDGFPATWLMPQIFDLVVYCNSKGTLNDRQAEFLAEVIAKEYGHLKASELLLFFYRFKTGKYGHFYGVVDPMRITEALDVFVDERNAKIAALESAEAWKERESRGDTISPEEWCRRAGLPECHTAFEAWQMRNRIQDQIEGVLWFINILWRALT